MSPAQINKTYRKSKSIRIILIVALVLLICSAGAVMYWNANKKTIIENKIESAIREKSDSLYAVSYDSLDLNELGGNFMLSNLHVFVDSSQLAKRKQNRKSPNALIDLKIGKISVQGLKTPKALLSEKIQATKLEIIDPDISITYLDKRKKRGHTVPMDQLHELILGKLDLIEVDTVVIRNGSITARSTIGNRKLVSLEGFSASFGDVRIDSAGGSDPDRLFFARSFTMSAGKASWSSSTSFYQFNMADIDLQTNPAQATIGKFSVIPSRSESSFSASGQRRARVDFSSGKIKFQGLDLKKLMLDELVADELIIGQASCEIFQDMAKSAGTKIHKGYYLETKQDGSSFLFDIGRVNISNSYLEYKERNKTSGQTGSVKFHNLNAQVKNLTNRVGPKSSAMTIDVQSQFLNTTPLTLNWSFYLGDPKGKFDVMGKAGGLQGHVLNKVIEPLCMASVREGSMQSLNFSFSGNDDNVNGNVGLLYQDLKLDLLELDSGAKRPDRKFLSSLVANFKVKNANPSGTDAPRTANVSVIRDQHFSIFAACWSALFQGISLITGMRTK